MQHSKRLQNISIFPRFTFQVIKQVKTIAIKSINGFNEILIGHP